MDNMDIEDLIREQIETPAAHRIETLLATGKITKNDVELFRVSADRFKAAALAKYDGFDPAVRHNLVKALLTNYQLEVQRLLTEIAHRDSAPASDSTSKPAQQSPGRADDHTTRPRRLRWLRTILNTKTEDGSARRDPP